MKVLLIITGLGAGGAEMICLKQAEYLHHKKYNVKVISFSTNIVLKSQFDRLGISVEILPLINVFSCVKLFKSIKSFQPSVVHTHLFHANVIGRIFAKLAGVPQVISTIHNVNFGGHIRKLLMRLTDPLATKTIVISKLVASEMMRMRIVKSTRLICIPNGIDTSTFVPFVGSNEQKRYARIALGLEPDGILFLSVGQLREQKAYHLLIDAICKRSDDLSALKTRFYVVGEGELLVSLRAKAKENNVSQLIQFIGLKTNIDEYLRATDAFVMTSLWEGLPLSMLEAMASGLPCIVPKVGGIPEVITNDQIGKLYEAGDVLTLSSLLVDIAIAPAEERALIGKNARACVVESFSQQKMLEEYEKLYKS